MNLRAQKGISSIDITVSVFLITIFMAFIITMINNINQSNKDIERKEIATSYAVQEIEKIKSQGYIDSYNGAGISQEDVIKQEDINDENGDFSGFTRKVLIKDYCLIQGNENKEKDILKIITVSIIYKSKNGQKNINISACIAKQ